MSLRTRSSIWTFLTQELFTIVSVLAAMVCTPLLLRWLGDERYGAFETLGGWLGYIALLEGGIGEAIQALFARAFGHGDRSASRKILIAAFRLYFRVAVLMIVAGAGIALVIARLVPVHPRYVHDLRIAWLLGLCVAPLQPLTAFKVLAQAEQRGQLVNSLFIGHWFVVTALSLLLAWAGWGISGQAAAVLAGAFVFNFTLAVTEEKRVSGIFAAFRDPVDSEVWKGISHLRWPGLVFNLCGTFSYLTDNIIVAFLMSPAAVVPFFITQRLPSLATRELQGIGGSSWAALTELHTQGQHEIFNARLTELTRLIAILAVAGLVPIVAYNHYFVDRWVGASRYGGDRLTIIAALNALLLAIFSLWAWVLNSTGHVRQILPLMCAQTTINFVGSIIFTLLFGIDGPVLGTLVAFAAVSIWALPILLAQTFETRPWALLRALAQPIALGVPYAVLVSVFSGAHGAADWFTIGWQMSASALGYLAIAALVLLTRSERAQWVQRFRVAVAPAAS